MAKFKMQCILHMAYNTLGASPEIPRLVCVCCRQSPKETGESQILFQSSQTEGPWNSGKKPLAFSIPVTVQNPGYQVLSSQPGFWSPVCIALTSDKMLKVKCMLARLTLLPFKMHGIVSFVNNKICWRFWGCVNYPVMPRRADGRIWRGRERAEWYLMCSDQEGDCET